MNKKAFTFIEMLISIVIFTIMITLIYNSFDHSKNTNKFIQNKLTKTDKNKDFWNIVLKDIMESSKIEIKEDYNNNSIIYLTTANTYHNPFFNKVIYLITNDHNLARIESAKNLKEYSINNLTYIKDYTIDVILDNIEKFKISKVLDENGLYSLAIKQDKSSLKIYNFKTFKN